ncbi:MAG: Crp/Fnr family transcriptional regulator [Paraprevotella sp.]|nr:Crp/Fnr family transcriptional regulator [Paraprevotella sp.]
MKIEAEKDFRADTIPVFAALSEEERRVLSDILVMRKVRKNEMVVRDGQICRHMVYVCRGLLRQYYFKNGREITEHFTCEGHIAYCIESIFKDKPSHLMMEALENSELCLIPYVRLVELSLSYRGIAEWLRHFLENNLILHQVKADSWRFESARERYERFLREFPTVANRASVNDMASYLLMTPESLSRVRTAVSNVSNKKQG